MSFIQKEEISLLVTDILPLHFSRKWKVRLKEKIKIPWREVDAHNVVPVWLPSPKEEFAARIIRPKLYKLLPEFLDEYDKIVQCNNKNLLEKFPAINFEEVKAKTKMKKIEGSKKIIFVGGEKAAHTALHNFLKNRLVNYDENRNDFTLSGQNNLSPYLSKGMLSRRRVALETLKWDGREIENILSSDKNGSNWSEGSTSAFLEELIIRAELAENFCFYNHNYNKVTGVANWARQALEKTHTDKREFIYSREEFKNARTHDELWNAAQNEMRETVKMHGYMRMYWAKKILQWTKSPEETLEIAMYLNDTYEQDSMDPNGYAGIMWSIAGLHDREWFPRPIFGTIRYMARSGAEKRGDVLKYIQTWNEKE